MTAVAQGVYGVRPDVFSNVVDASQMEVAPQPHTARELDVFFMPEWRERAACRDLDRETVFYSRRPGAARPEGIAACESCPVRDECEQQTVEFELEDYRTGLRPHGYAAGMTPAERAVMYDQMLADFGDPVADA